MSVLAIFICVLSILCAFVKSPTMIEGAPQVKKLPTQTETQAPSFPTGEASQEAPAQEAPAQQ